MSRTHQRVNVSAQLAASLFREGDEWEAKGDLLNSQKARDAGNAMLEQEGIKDRSEAEARASESVPFTVEEDAQADLDAVAAAKARVAADVAAAEREALVGKLSLGTASDSEVQQALAKLLGGTT